MSTFNKMYAYAYDIDGFCVFCITFKEHTNKQQCRLSVSWYTNCKNSGIAYVIDKLWYLDCFYHADNQKLEKLNDFLR